MFILWDFFLEKKKNSSSSQMSDDIKAMLNANQNLMNMAVDNTINDIVDASQNHSDAITNLTAFKKHLQKQQQENERASGKFR